MKQNCAAKPKSFVTRAIHNVFPLILGGKVAFFRVLASSGRRGGFTQPFLPILRENRYLRNIGGAAVCNDERGAECARFLLVLRCLTVALPHFFEISFSIRGSSSR